MTGKEMKNNRQICSKAQETVWNWWSTPSRNPSQLHQKIWSPPSQPLSFAVSPSRFNLKYNYDPIIFDNLFAIFVQLTMIRKKASRPLTVLLISSSLAALSAITALILAIVYNYRGFGWANTPISCSGQTYFITKYNHNSYLTIVNIGGAVAFLSAFVVACISIFLRVELAQGKQEDQEKQFQHWGGILHKTIFILCATCILFQVVPTGYFLSFLRQANSECNTSITTEWILIAFLSLLTIIAQLVSIAVIFLLKEQFQDELENEQEDNALKMQEEIISNKQNRSEQSNKDNILANRLSSEQNQREQQQSQENKPALNTSNVQVQIIEKQLSKKQSIKKQMSQPLLIADNPMRKSNTVHPKTSDGQYESQKLRLLLLQEKRIKEEEKIAELQRQKIMLTSKSLQQQPITVTQHESTKDKDKASANQTIINIHLGNGQTAATVAEKQQQKKEQKRPTKRSKGKKYETTIYEEESQESEIKYHFKPKNRRDRDRDRYQVEQREMYPRYVHKSKYHAKQTSPYFRKKDERQEPFQQEYTKAFKAQHQNPKLSYGHAGSISIGPSSISPQNISSVPDIHPILPDNQLNKVNSHNPFEKKSSRVHQGSIPLKKTESRAHKIESSPFEKKDQSLVNNLMDQSIVINKVPTAKFLNQAPKKRPKMKKQNETQLQAYIKALNKNFSTNRPNFNSEDEVSYSSILSQFQRGQAQTERQLPPFSRQEMKGYPGMMRQSWLDLQRKIDSKYKQN